MRKAYPLDWPTDYTRNQYTHTSKFKGTLTENFDKLVNELKLFRASDIIISTNIPLNSLNKPNSSYNRGLVRDYGVAAYFTHKGVAKVFCCDYWNSVEDNLKALARTISNIRCIDRDKVSQILDRTIHGFDALPETTDRDPYEVLGCKPIYSSEEVRSCYRNLTKLHHPDTGGDRNKFEEVQRAWQTIKKERAIL